MKAADYRIVPGLMPPIVFPFLVVRRLDDSYQYTYGDYLRPSGRLKASRAIRLNIPYN